ncbi:MAG: flavodoxin family protein [Lachnospiraceae bacterium]|nr:flavodoxin family protein [Lachnospiraceae bacterium]
MPENKKILGIACSALPRSNSMKLMEEFMRGAQSAGYDTEIIRINEDLLGCTGCKWCKHNDSFCVRYDVLAHYFQELPSADAVVLSFGIYMGYPQGEAWMFMNRHYCLHTGAVGGSCRIEPGKKFYTIISQGAPDNPEYRAHCEALLKPFDAWGFVREEPLVSGGGHFEEKMKEAFALGAAL